MIKEEKYGPRELEGELEISDFNEWAKKYEVSTLHVESNIRYRMDYYRDKLSIVQEKKPETLKDKLIFVSHMLRDELIEKFK